VTPLWETLSVRQTAAHLNRTLSAQNKKRINGNMIRREDGPRKESVRVKYARGEKRASSGEGNIFLNGWIME
jgi:hypothetical protein